MYCQAFLVVFLLLFRSLLGFIYGGGAIALTAFILFIIIMQSNFTEAPEAAAKDQKEKDEETSEQEPETEISYLAKYVNISSLNVRSGPGVDHYAVRVVTLNQELEAEESSGWIRVKTDNMSGYVNSKYLSEEEVVVQAADTIHFVQKFAP